MKLLLVRSAQLSSWGSCKVISPNLQKTYNSLPGEFQISWFDIPLDFIEQEIDSRKSSLFELAQKIQSEKPHQLIFVDHLPCPADVLSKLSLYLDIKKIPPVTIHAYGDFTYFSKEWMIFSDIFKNHPVRIIAASSSQKKLIDSFCEDPDTVETLFFPVNNKEYYFDINARTRLRSEHQIAENDIVILYSGRVSLQKNIDILLLEYFDLLKKQDINIHLWIAGGFDDLGAPFMGISTTEGYLFSKIQNIIKSHSRESGKNIKLWGLQNKNELQQIKSASDLFVSLSLYHDEDFGMSPAEALSCGLPTLLTDWGGYSSFSSGKWNCKLMPVKISEYGLEIKTSVFHEFVENYKATYVSHKDRERWAKAFQEEYSIEACTLKLESLLRKNFHSFSGFNWAIVPLSQTYGKHAQVKTIDPHSCPSSKNFYAQIYQNYISPQHSGADFYKTVQWTYDYIQNSSQDSGMPVSRKVRAGHFYLKPFSLDYYSPLNPVLLGGYLTKILRPFSTCLLRDGLIPLTFFFRELTPQTSYETVVIPKSFWNIVPANWKNNVLFYETIPCEYFSETNIPERILIAGMNDSTFADEDEFEDQVLKLKNTFDKHWHKIKITAIFPTRKNNLWGKKIEENGFVRAQALKNLLNTEIQFVDWDDLKSESQFNNCLYFEINRHYFIADSFLKYFTLSKGAGLLKDDFHNSLPFSRVSEHKLSLFHSQTISKLDFTIAPDFKDPFNTPEFFIFQQLANENLKTVKITSSWDSWYPLFLKKYYSGPK